MAVAAGKVREPLAGPGGQVARPCIQLVAAAADSYTETLLTDACVVV